MDIKEYQEFCKEGIREESKGKNEILNFIIGLAGEVGEVCNCIKKREFHGRVDEVSIEDIVDECGDVMWYLMNLISSLGYNVEDVIKMNVNKLHKRYKNLYK